MKNARRISWILAAFLILTAFAKSAMPGKLRKGFEALEVYNYFKAKELFYKSLKRDSVPAAYGLSVIYGRDDNPFFQIDSAFKFIKIAHRNYPSLDVDDEQDYSTLGVDSITISQELHRIDSLYYEIALDQNAVAEWNDFISNHQSAPFYENAIRRRNLRAFRLAQDENSSAAYLDFLEKYPDAKQVAEARKMYESQLFNEQTAGGSIQDYLDFIQNFPKSPYISDAENRIYEIATKKGQTTDYVSFIHNFPKNRNWSEAWRNVYKLEIGELSPKSIAAFSLKYPDYPYMQELKQDFEYATTHYYPIMVDSLWGFIDEVGTVRISPTYDWVEPFSENMALVGKRDGVAFINKAGKQITGFEYDDAYNYKNGYAVVEKNGKVGVINRLGEKIIPLEYQDVGEFQDNLFYAQNQEGKYGYLDNNGEISIPFILDNASDFSAGLAVVEKNGAQGVIDKRGFLVVDFKYDWVEPFSGDIKPSRVRIGSQFGLIDHHGIVLADTLYTQIGDFSDGLAMAAGGDKYGYLNLHGDTAIAFKYTYTQAALKNSVFVNNHARIYQDKKVGIIDTAGTKIFPAIFEDTGDYIGKLIPVKKHGKWGYADLKIDLAIKYKYDSAENFKDSLAVVTQNGKYGVIDTLGNHKIDFKYKTINILDSLILVSDTAYGIINQQEIEKVPMIYENAKILDNGVIRFEKSKAGSPDYYDIFKQKFIWRQNF